MPGKGVRPIKGRPVPRSKWPGQAAQRGKETTGGPLPCLRSLMGEPTKSLSHSDSSAVRGFLLVSEDFGQLSGDLIKSFYPLFSISFFCLCQFLGDIFQLYFQSPLLSFHCCCIFFTFKGSFVFLEFLINTTYSCFMDAIFFLLCTYY